MPALVLTVVLAAALTAGCGSDDGPSTEGLPEVPSGEFVDETGNDAVEVRALDNRFDPQYVTVSVGTEVTFVNDGRNQHNVLAVDEGAFADVPVEEFEPGDSATITFDEPGTYAYYCSLHATPTRGMTGRIVVEE